MAALGTRRLKYPTLGVQLAAPATAQVLFGHDWQVLATAEYVLAPHWIQVPVVVLW